MEIWENIKHGIKTETKDYFALKGIDTNPLVDLLQKLINFPIEEEFKISGLDTNLTHALETFFNDDSGKKDKLAHFQYLKNFEPLLKKIIYIENKEKLRKLQSEKEMGIRLLTELNLNPKAVWLDEKHLKEYTTSDYEYYLIKSYLLRNTESHNMEIWSNKDLESNIDVLLIFYLEIINRCSVRFESKLITEKNDFNSYIDNEIANFEELAKTFVATKTIEDYSVFEAYGIEHKISGNEDSDKSLERSGTIDEIRKNKLPERRMLLWGEAGLGKSTTLKYLTYLDAKAYKNKSSDIIPVYIPLGMMIDKEESLEAYIFRKIKVSFVDGKELLESGKLSLFLDGINEIPEDKNTEILTRRIREIQNFIDNYKKTLIIITNRPEKYNRLNNIPVFRLQRMDYNRIVDFVNKNTDSEDIKNIILAKIENNSRLLKAISIPLMTSRFIEIVEKFHKVPESEGEIIKDFLETIYKREMIEKKDYKFDEDKINILLAGLASYGFSKNNTNSGLSRTEALNCFKECLKNSYIDYDIAYALDILIKLGILSCDIQGNVIVFSHQSYQDYYLGMSGKSPIDIGKNDTNFSSKLDEIKKEEQYEIISNDKKYEKSITYQLHNMERSERNEEIKNIAKHNIALSAEIVASGQRDEEIENFVIEQSKVIFEDSDSVIKAKCILSCIELGETVNLNKYIRAIIDSDEKDVFKYFLLDSEEDQILEFCKALMIQNIDDSHKKDVNEYIIKQLSKRDVKFTWNKTNISFVNNYSDYLNALLNDYSLLKFYLVFDVPKNKIKQSVFEYAKNNLSRRMYFEQCFNFLQNYDEEFDLAGSIKQIISEVKESQQYFYYYKLIENLLTKNKQDTFIKIFKEDSVFRAVVFIFLKSDFRENIANQYRYFYYYDGENPYLLYTDDVNKLGELLVKFDLVQEYSKQCKTLEKLQFRYISGINI